MRRDDVGGRQPAGEARLTFLLMLCAFDVGAATTDKIKEAVQRAGSVFWTGLLGNVECRLADNTIQCDGPWLVICRHPPPVELSWAPMPERRAPAKGGWRSEVSRTV